MTLERQDFVLRKLLTQFRDGLTKYCSSMRKIWTLAIRKYVIFHSFSSIKTKSQATTAVLSQYCNSQSRTILVSSSPFRFDN